jgi:hypothetical protein
VTLRQQEEVKDFDHLAEAKHQLLFKPDRATAHAAIAIAELLKKQQEPIEVRIDPQVVVPVPKPVEARDREFVPGDMVGLTIKSAYHNGYNGRHGVVTYGRDHAGGWIVTTAVGDLRCGPDELTMITRREDRTQETDVEAHKWKEGK